MELARTRLARRHDDSLAAVVAILSKQDTASARPEISFDFSEAELTAVDARIRPVTTELLERYLAALRIHQAARPIAAAAK
jgi:hypothetical protein